MMRNLWRENAEKCVDYTEKALDYAEVSPVNKIDDKLRTTVKRKALQSLTDNVSYNGIY